MNIFSNKKYLLYGVIGIILLILAFFTSIYTVLNPASIAPPILPVSKIIPDPSTPLTAGTTQSFVIELTKRINLGELKVALTRFDPGQDTKKEVPHTVAYASDKLLLTITTNEQIFPDNQYTIEITHNKTSAIMFQAFYTSIEPQPTFVQSNNLELAKYLPYETSNYKLYYDTYRNIYVFNFFYDPESSDEPFIQEESARKQAQEFIQSKGINPTSIIIDWDTK